MKNPSQQPVPMPGKSHFEPKGTMDAVPITGIPLYSGFESVETRKFVVNGFQDVWAAVLFVLLLFLTFVWGIVNYSSNLQGVSNAVTNSTTNSSQDGPSTVQAGTLVGVVFLLVAVGTALALAALALLCKFAERAIIVANVATGALDIVAGIIAFAYGVTGAGVILLICGLLQLLWLYLVRDRIPFSALLLKHGSELVMKYKAIILVNFALVGFFTIYFLFWASMLFPYLNRSVQSSQATPSDGILTTFFVFLLFWTTQVMFNVMHVTAAGVAATWYFVGTAAMPPNPTMASFKRAITTSFGSICFGSMLVAFVKVLRWLAERYRKHDDSFLACIAECLIACLERLLEYFNTYAFVHVAIYGCSYLEAAKRTWELTKSCFFAAYFNDALVGTTIFVISLAVSAFVGVITGVASGSVALGSIVFCICFSVHSLVFRSLDSFVVSLFVCFAEQPQALQVTSPDLYSMLVQADNQL